jgi:MFS transporter, DHA1 family, tetracycline resistance protein
MPFILITVLIDMVSIGLIIPVLPPLVGTFTTSQADQAFWFGAVMFAFGIANFFGSPILGALSDRYGRRPILLLGFTGLALSFFVTAIATTLSVLIVVR